MTRMQVELRLRNSTRKIGSPPSYQQVKSMSDAKITPSLTNLKSRRRVNGSFLRDDETESYADSFESEDEEENDNEREIIGEKVPEFEASEVTLSENLDATENEIGKEDIVVDATGSECIDEDASVHNLNRKKLRDRPKTTPERQTLINYDLHTYTVISQLKAVNKRLNHQLEQQNKLLTNLTEEKKQHLLIIDSLRAEMEMYKQRVRVLHPKTQASLPVVSRMQPKDEEVEALRALRPRSPFRRPSLSASNCGKRKSPRTKAFEASEVQSCSCGGGKTPFHTLELYMIKLEKAEERKDLQQRHSHQLANYSHELSRIERLLEKAHVEIQEKDNELRLQRTRQLYCGTFHAPSSSKVPSKHRKSLTGQRESLQVRNIFSDDLWKGFLPTASTVSSTVVTPVPFTSHVGQAFEQLVSHQFMAQHDNPVDKITRDWLQEVRQCGSQMLTLHHSFQVMASSLQHIAECTHLYQLAEVLTHECRELIQAEQVLVLVVDKSEHEFWCRMSARLTADKDENKAVKTMSTVRSALPSLSPSPCGLASLVYHTKSPLLLSAGEMVRHPSYSVANDNADRLVMYPSASTLLVPILHDNHVLAIVQVCGKLRQVEALGLSIAIEKSDTFTTEDEALLTLLCHFSSGLFPKVAYFTDVESNKVNEETFIQLAPEIFTCLHFDDLGKVVIENAKNILDADRCSLFVADSVNRTLHNWHSDISGAGVQVYQKSAQKSTTGMTIHFGQGIVGLVAETKQSINIPDAYEDPRFNSAWDQKTHYRTKSMLTVPILSKNQLLLGVVQVINKAGGSPFRAKDEFLLQTISKLIALAIENSQLFQRNQELCWNVGKLISDGDLVEAIVSLGTAAEQIIGVEGAAVYVVDPETHELVTFHHKRRYRIALSASAYTGSLMEDAVRSQELTIVNEIGKADSFNAFIDSLNGIPARNVLFAPLVIEDSDSLVLGMKNAFTNDEGTRVSGSRKKLVGLLQLVNTTGRKTHFDQHDLFLSIVQSQSCSVLAAILEKQRMMRQKEQIALLLDVSMSFFKEMSVIGVINAVYNACVSIFDAKTTAHLYLWEDSINSIDKDRDRLMWTSKIAPQAAASLTTQSCSLVNNEARVQTAMSFIPSLGAQPRKLSVMTDQTLRAPTSDGLFHQVLTRGSAVVVKNWIVDEVDQEHAEMKADNPLPDSECTFKSASRYSNPRVDKYTMKATRSDVRLGFIHHAVVACPVWSSYRQEIVGVLILLFPHDHPAVAGGSRSEQLSTLPILTRQISGALGVCHDLTNVSTRSRKMQRMLEFSRQSRVAAVSFTLTCRGHLGSFSQPLNLCSKGFNLRSLFAQLHPLVAANLTIHSLFMDEEGHRWGFQLSGATAHEMSCDHFMQWIGKDVELPSDCTEAQVFGKLRMDLLSVYTQKEVVTGTINTALEEGDGDSSDEDESRVDLTLSRAILLKIRQLLWEFTDSDWQVDVNRAIRALFGGFMSENGLKDKKMLTRNELEQVLEGAGILLSIVEWEQLYLYFADKDTGLVNVERMLIALRPQLKTFPVITYELAPVLDTVTQVVVSVQVLLHA